MRLAPEDPESRYTRDARRRLEALESRLLGAGPPLPEHYWQFREDLRKALEDATLDGCLKGSFREIEPLLQFQRVPDPRGVARLSGGERHEAWEGAGQLERDDRARINFFMEVRYRANARPELIMYHFNLAFPTGQQPAFVRFDLNEAAFVQGGTRDVLMSPFLCHLHKGHPKMTVPSPLLSPVEILDVLLRGHLR